jgi:site-specific DNA-methyltransferase (adenine-specific)
MSRFPIPPRNLLLIGDAARQLRRLPEASVDMVLTSPPYFRLRDYDADGQLGLENHVDEWVDGLTEVAQQAGRVLVPTGSFWLKVSDTFSAHVQQGAARKSLLLGPERLALRLLQDGWVLRNKIVWSKTNPMPTSVRDRLSCTWEAIYVFTKQPHYFFALDAIRVPHTSSPPTRHRTPERGNESWRGPNSDSATGLDTIKSEGRVGHPLGKNPGDVWRIPSSNYRGAHHATFPITLAERAIRAGCPEARCVACRLPWRRRTIRSLGSLAARGSLQPSCSCRAAGEPGLVLDPFMGAGTTAVAAEQLDRDWLGVELNPDFAALAERRISDARLSEGKPVIQPKPPPRAEAA